MNNLDVTMTNICTEITLHTDEEHSFICCLSSLNLAKYDEWKDTDVVETAITGFRWCNGRIYPEN